MIHAGAVKTPLLRVAAVVMVLVTLLGVFSTTAYAAGNGSSFDNTKVLDDLLTSTVNGKPFDIRNYPFDENGEVQVISLIEYCYSYKANQRDNYGLYVYIYNPKGLNLSTDSKRNKIQMATSYNKDGNPSAYEKFSLEFCSKVETGDYKNLFYKYKVVDRKVNGTTFDQRVNSNERRYDISGIELTVHGSGTATEYHVGTTYRFTGYAAGYGQNSNEESTLHCEIETLETISLSVKHTFYRSKTSTLGAGHQNQLDTVYFTVPKSYIEEYGKLQRIKAEWYEYKTKDILVTSNAAFYAAAKPYVGVPLGSKPNQYGQYEYVEDIGYSLGINAGKAGDMYVADWGWNLGTGYFHSPTNVLYYMFYVSDIDEYDPYAKKVSSGGAESNELYEYIRAYTKTYENGRLPVKNGTISADLFEADIDESRKMDNQSGKIQMGYQDTKVYYDGSHYIAIPKRPAPRHPGARLPEDLVEVVDEEQKELQDEPTEEQADESDEVEEKTEEVPSEAPKKPAVKRRATRRELFNELYQKLLYEPRRSRRGKLIQGMRPYFKTEEEAIEYVDKQLERKQRNLICRRMRFSRKVNLHEFNYFCTFTYDGSLHTEKTFRERLAVCFNRFCSRKGWKYAGVWERSPKTGRLHFHGIFYIPEGTMPGILYEKEDYNFNTRRRQVTIQNTYFNERLGRCDIEPIRDRTEMGSAMAYIMKYIEKSGEKIVYSRGLPQYFKSDILDDDVVCPIGMEDQKLLLFDNFSCFEDGVYIGEVSPEVIKQMKKAN